LIEKKQVDLDWIDGSTNPADILTKNLKKVKFHLFCPMLGLVEQ
jgi:hypothetical protein